jgi:putative nucleotidyltransferase with HDIG domain
MRGVAQGPYHHLNVWKHSLETLRQLEILFGELKGKREINAYLDEILSAGRSRRASMKLGALLHDVGKPRAKRRKGKKTIFHGHERIGADISGEVCRRLKLSNDEIEALKKMVLWHLRPGYLGDNPVVSPRAKFRYFRDTATEGISTLVLSIADQRATRGPLTSKSDRLQHERVCLGLIRDYLRSLKKPKLLRLLNGDMLMKRFKLEPSPVVGKILAELEELQAIGKVKTIADAWRAAAKIAHEQN